ncbi:MAG: 16S rRNA (adenine(1518)-N(6)/adenine(1519)-N(6))-dimethyltransferase RsmA [Henriciella sp.]|nr:16S rRNA (adenine(1518)-N(6)/adenine(1519)-N(6))-dimethyltransferase RsmA [Henriciella sp.]MBO6694644.1 16S rRNA (adenine(1518)-N(6)/adenine(1519)-N(6))-dimethyltransferase RsmA [Henriciella sp.]
MDDRPELTQARARKALGQHFLFDPDILRRTALAAGPVEGRTVIEVGPGPGGLTRAILDAGARSLTCVEADARFADGLRMWPEAKDDRLSIIEMDARKVAWENLPTVTASSSPAMIIANLPYNVGTPLLVNWLKAGRWRGEMALMFQKEVAERVCASPGERHYGRLAVLTAAVCEAHIAFTLPPGAFNPPPKVDSAVAVFRPLHPDARYGDLASLEKITTAAFGQRRKMMRASLRSLAKTVKLDTVHWLESCNIDPTARAETLSQSDFRALADKFGEATHAGDAG